MPEKGICDHISKAMDDISSMPKLNQAVVGSVAGIGTGFAVSRVGREAAFAIGAGVILLQIAQHMGYVRITMNRHTAKKEFEELKKRASEAADKNKTKLNRMLEETEYFIKTNVTFVACFAAGVAVGMSSA